MSRSIVVRPLQLLGACVMLLPLLLGSAAASAAVDDEECEEASTPNIVITAVNASGGGPRMTLTVQTDKNGSPHWNIVYRDGSNRLQSLEIHRAFIKADESHEAMTGSVAGGCSGDDEGGMTGAGIRGIGYVNGVKMRFQIDLKDYGNNPNKSDQVRLRWRPYDPSEEGHGGSGVCEEMNWSHNVWVNVQQVNIIQR